MDVNADNHGEERIPFFGMDSHIMKMVVIEDPVVNPFAGSTVAVNLFILVRATWNGSVKADVPGWFGVNAAAIRGRRAFFFAGTRTVPAADKGAAPFAGMFLFTVAPVDHTITSHAQGSTICVNGNGVRDGTGPAPFFVQVDERADIPFLAESVSSIVVMSRIQTEITDRDIRIYGSEFPQGNNSADAVMASGVKEADMERQVNADI